MSVPAGLEALWGIVRPKTGVSKFRNIIICSFYSPPTKGKNTKLADHISSTLHMLCTQYPESGLILGADKNSMNINPILNCGLKLRQIVDKFTRKKKTIDIIITNLGSYYKSSIIAPPITPDNPTNGEPSDHSVPVCIPHCDPLSRPERNYKLINFRPLPATNISKFGGWIVQEKWDFMQSETSVKDLAEQVDKYLNEKLEKFCPKKSLKLSQRNNPFITTELKHLARKRNREYIRNGKTLKYY